MLRSAGESKSLGRGNVQRAAGGIRPPRIYLDLSRLIFAAWNRTPVGIPRVELAYAEYLIANFPDELHFVVLDALGRLRILERRRATEFIAAITHYWNANVASNRTYLSIALRNLDIHARLLFGITSLFRTVRSSDRPSVYIICSQLHFENAPMIERLKRSEKLRLVYFVHDIIPTTFPEYFPPDAEDRCRRRMVTAGRLADLIIASSQDTATEFRRNFAPGMDQSSIVVAALGVGLSPEAKAPAEPSSSSPYFVMVGTIEPRKNHLLILNLWRTFHRELGEMAPRLILVGSRGWENENVIDMLERSPGLATLVQERGRVSDEEMTRLLVGARALLMPSFAEGYGLPLAEALALGVPALCSDIPVFREIAGAVPEFIDPLDGPGWNRVILDFLPHDSPRRKAQLARLHAWRAPTWSEHFQKVIPALKLSGERAQ